MNQVFRIYSEKRPPFAVAAQSLAQDLRRILDVDTVDRVRILYRYDVSNLTPAQFEAAIPVIFSEPQVDVVCRDLPAADGATVFAVEYLPGQYLSVRIGLETGGQIHNLQNFIARKIGDRNKTFLSHRTLFLL